MSFSLTSLIPGVGPEFAHVATVGIISTSFILVGWKAKKDLGTGEKAIVPAHNFSVRGVFEFITEFIVGLSDMVIGPHGRHYVPYFSSIFIFILINNLVGVLPGMTPATENFNTTLSMGTIMFLAYNIIGIRKNGSSYFKHFLGPVWWLIPIFLVVEMISHLVRPFSLGLRLANVMKGDHTVVGIFTDLVPLLLPIPFYLLGIFVCFIQAFVFTLLSMVYVALASTHEEH